MAIYQRDRDFYHLFSEINVDVIPIKFIKDITCYLTDGSSITLKDGDFSQEDIETNDLEKLIKGLEFYEEMTDLRIRIDYDRVEKDVDSEVSKILRNKDK